MRGEGFMHYFASGKENRIAEQEQKGNELIRGEEITLNYSPPEQIIASEQPEIQKVIAGLNETAHIRVYLPNSLQMPNSAERKAVRHTARGAIVKQDAGVVNFDKLAGRGGEVPMMLVAKGIGAKYQGVYYRDPSIGGTEKSQLSWTTGAHQEEGATVDTFRNRTVNEETYLEEDSKPEVMFLTPHSHARPYGGQTLPLAEASLECSEALVGSNIKYTPEVAVVPFSDEIKNKIIAATKRAGMPISEELTKTDLAQELILYPQSTRRGLELISCWDKMGDDRYMKAGQKTIDELFPSPESKEHFLDQMADDAYWILNWPARNASVSDNGDILWRKFNDFNLNNTKLHTDLELSRRHRDLLQNNIPIILEGRKSNCRFDNIQDPDLKEKLSKGFFHATAGEEWVPFVLKDLIIDPEYGCFITDFESSEVEPEQSSYGISDHELWIYGVLYEFLTMAVSISDTTENFELINMINGRSMYYNKEVKDYKTFYEEIKKIYLKVLRRLEQQKGGEMEIKLSNDENEIEVMLNYKDKRIPPKTFKFHILDFIKM